ncbi:hypothetical protein BD413DRAFT_65960 [Trametes elegans]|nr:hypothetical protein BD413DRAFT_65960 [Trametes elegans]
MGPLPTELIDAILGHAYYIKGIPDKATLKACALVSSSWTDPAQRLLFRQVALHGLHQGPGHVLFCAATNPSTERGRTLGQYVRVLEISIGEKSGPDLDDEDLVELLSRTPRLYELALRVAGIRQFSTVTLEKLEALAHPAAASTYWRNPDNPGCLRLRALTILSCGIQSPIVYEFLHIWPTIEFLYIGVEIAAPPPRWTPSFRLYQLTLMRTPRLPIISWLLQSSLESLRIVSFRDAPGRELNPILEAVGPRLRSLHLMNYNLRAAAVLKYCPNLEEFVIIQLSTLFQLENLPSTLMHLCCRNLPSEDQMLVFIINAVSSLPRLQVLTCNYQAIADEHFPELQELCNSKAIELFLDEAPFWVREDPVYVDRFPRKKSVANFALMN